MTDRVERTIDAARRSFNRTLFAPGYPHTHHDEDHIARLVALLDPQRHGHYLDLGTGNGEVAFPIAARQPESRVIGVDIADRAILHNQAAANERGCTNVTFHASDGRMIDLPDATLDGAVSRYALHHFPDIGTTLGDVRRALRPGAPFVIADAVRHAADKRDFINQFQALEPDGHVRIYTAHELIELFRDHGFEATEQFGSAISFTRSLNPDYHDLIDHTPPGILDMYDVTTTRDQAALTFSVLNVRFVASTT